MHILEGLWKVTKKIQVCIFSFIVFSVLHLNAMEQTYNRCFVHKEINGGICFFNSPKNASNTIRNILNVNRFILYDAIKDEIDSYTKIMCVRDPLYKPISIYNELMKLRKDGKYNITKNTTFYALREDPCLSFNLFLDFIDGNFYDGHLSHQYMFLEYKGLSLSEMDFILLFENLDEDLKKFCSIYRQSFEYKKINEGVPTVKSILERFIDENSEIQNKIKKIWFRDFIFYEQAKERRKEVLNNIPK